MGHILGILPRFIAYTNHKSTMEYSKVYVAVLLRVSEEGTVKPLSLEWCDGRTFDIQKITEIRMCPPPHVQGVLTKRYKILVDGQPKELFLETLTGRWFVEKPHFF